MESPNNCTTDAGMKSVLTYINIFMIPIIITIGVVGNTISFFVFVATHLKYKSSSVYLAALNIVDTGFLISLIPAWLGWLHVDVFHMTGWCQTTIYSSYVFAFLSVWIVVSFTAERFVVVFFPLKRSSFCTVKHAVVIVGLLLLFALLLYSYTIWTTSVEQQQGLPLCMPKVEYHSLLKALSAVDTVTTLVIPCISICIMNGSICGKLVMYYREQSSQTSHQRPVQPPATELHEPEDIPEATCLDQSKSTKQKCRTLVSIHSVSVQLEKQRNFQNQTTRTLLIISSIFILLNFPSHAFRVYIVSMALSGEEYILSSTMSTVQELCLLLYYTNFASNLFLYSVCNRSFRSALKKLCKKSKRKIDALFLACFKKRIWFTVTRYPSAAQYPRHHMTGGRHNLRHGSEKSILN